MNSRLFGALESFFTRNSFRWCHATLACPRNSIVISLTWAPNTCVTFASVFSMSLAQLSYWTLPGPLPLIHFVIYVNWIIFLSMTDDMCIVQVASVEVAQKNSSCVWERCMITNRFWYRMHRSQNLHMTRKNSLRRDNWDNRMDFIDFETALGQQSCKSAEN